MKNHKLFVLAGCLWASSLLAQTADEYVTMGRTNLVAHNLVAANADFTNALALSPANEDANALAAVTRLLLLPQQTPGSNFLNRIGFSAGGRDIYGWTATLPKDTNGNTVLPANFNSSEAISFYRTNIMVALAAARTNLARITDPGFTLSLTAGETSVGEAVTVDYGDILLLQALERAAEFMGYTLNAHNFSVVINHIKDLGDADTLTVQRILSDYPSLLNQSSASDLAASKGAFTNAIMLYQQASDFIRNVRPPGAERLFDLSPDETNNEALFRSELTNALQSLNQPVQFNTNATFSLNLSNYFAGTRSLRSLTPQFNGNRYVINTLPDYTFGGILGGEPACDVESLLRHVLNRPDAGIYTGDLYDPSYNYAGVFAAFLGTDMQAKIVGYDDNIGASAFAQFSVDSGGGWSFETNGVSDYGPFIVSSYGSFNKDGSFYGDFDYFDTNYNYLFSQQLNGDWSSPLGTFQSSAGYYSGNWSGSGQSGKLYCVLTADGQVYFATIQPDGKLGDGGLGQLDSANHFTTTDFNGSVVSGTNNPATLTLSGTFVSTDLSGKWSMTRSANVPFDVPPVITTPPTNKTVPLGTNVTFSVVATGSPPLCYQWFSNDVAIAKATNTSLVLSNVTYACATNYSVSVRNVAGGTNATALLTVVPETIKPTNQIVTPTSGLQVSNAPYTITGKAGDNVLVSNVWYKLNNSDWDLASSTNNWTNWWADVTLTPGTNIVQAYAVDTSGNVSTTNSVSFVYVLSAVLTVNTNGYGTINPNYNGTSLQIGKSYSMTATAGTGFGFTGWTGSFATNGATLTFTMAPSLTFTANFVDVTRPTLSITNLASGQRVSNETFTVRGTATDNWMVSNVWYRLNGDDWDSATGTNNWWVEVDLTPGTNIFLAYAVDTSGNRSTTNNVTFQYIVSTPLQVQMTGLGTISPNYSNAVLAIGTNYSMTASPGTGFMFTNWTGGTSMPLAVLTNGTTVKFVMVSNLTLQANFLDTSKPTLSITNLTAGQRVSNDTFTVKGTASDNWMVSNVWCQINGLGWNSATNLNNWTNWSGGVTLIPGTNVVQAYAMDTSGNVSTTNSVSFQFVVTNQLGVRAIGLGTISPNYSNAWLEIGRNYSMTATQGSGFVFTNWTISTNWIGEMITNKATVQFMMESNLTLQVSFTDVTKPTLTITAPTAGQHLTNALANVKGTASDNWRVTNVWYQLNSNAWSQATSTNGWTNWTVTLPLVAGTNSIKAYAVDLGANLSTTNNVSFVSSNTFTLQLGITTGEFMTSNGFGFNLQVSPGLNGRIEASTNLVNWVTLTNFVGTNTTIYFRDVAATNLNLRFYRAATP
jgi:hypothetical protein